MRNVTQNFTEARGFTLVELLVAFVVIGFLIGGILQSKEFVQNARVTSTIGQVNAIQTASIAFVQQYNLPPGDYDTPAMLPNCTDTPCTSGGNGDGLVWDYPRTTNGYGPHEGTMPNSENMAFWAHLAATGLYAKTDPNNGITGNTWADVEDLGAILGVTNPEAAVGGGFHIGYTALGLEYEITDTPAGPGHYLALKYNPGRSTAGGPLEGPVLTANIAARIDRKMDDGHPGKGEVRAAAGGVGAPGDCAEDGVYLEENGDLVECALYFRMDLEASTGF